MLLPRLPLALLLAAAPWACRRNPPPVSAPASVATPAAPPPAAELPTQPAVAAAPSPAPAPTRATPPSADEIRVALDPLFPIFERCVKNAGLREDARGKLRLRFVVEPSGLVSSGDLAPLESAHVCATDALAALRFAPWHGTQAFVTIALDDRGQPIRDLAPPDGGGGEGRSDLGRPDGRPSGGGR